MSIFTPDPSRVDFFKNRTSISPNTWDPTNKQDWSDVQNNIATLVAQFEALQKDPTHFSRNIQYITYAQYILFFLLFIVVVLGFFVSLFFFFFLHGPIFLLIASFFGKYYYRVYARKITKDFVKYALAREKEWIYDSSNNFQKAVSLAEIFPEIFKKGNYARNISIELPKEISSKLSKIPFSGGIDDQIWGLYGKIPFYAGVFEYDTGSGKSSHRVKTHYFSIKLSGNVRARFHLYREDAFSKIKNIFSEKEIDLESMKFNKTFAFSYEGKKSEKAIDIASVLTPAVQEKILKLNDEQYIRDILFVGNVAFFLFDGELLDNLKTDFIKSFSIATEDRQNFEKKVRDILDVATELSRLI